MASPTEPRRRRIIFFLTVVPLILLAATGFVSVTWSHFSGASGLVWQLLPLLLSVGFIPLTLLSRRHYNPALRIVYTTSAIWLGLLNFSLVAAIGCWIVAGAAAVSGLSLDPRGLAAVCFGGAILATVYGVANAAWVRVTRVTVSLRNLPAAWQGRSVALVTDLHLGNVRGRRFVRRLVARLRKLQPEAVFIGGDMFDGTKVRADDLVQPWRDLQVPAGIYFVSGNHEEFGDRGPYLAAVQRAGIRVLNNEKTSVQGLQLVGVHDAEAGEPQLFAKILQAAKLDPSQASILLAHQPSNLAVPQEAGISLQLSGHTHGGQFWPWNLVAAKVHKQFVYGLNRFGPLSVLTSSGAGTWGPPLRVGTRAEIVLIRLESASTADLTGRTPS
jgi:uncharacterized protein